MKRKEVLEITGYTFANQGSKEESWYNSAISFHEGASILAQHKDSIQGGTRVFLVNVALSLELLLKAIIVAQGESAPRTHELRDLAVKAGVDFTESQKTTLELLEEIFKWRGRYPVPNKASDWDIYHDQIFERHVIRERVGNTSKTRANPETFPSIENSDALWTIVSRKWDEVQPL
jgi:HEPN domain-containing protein